MNKFSLKLQELEKQGRRRVLDPSKNGVDLTSNDYLAFANHPFLRKAAIEFFENGGSVGSVASRLLRGEVEAHHALEEFAAEYFGAPSTLFFANGFQANYALFTTLAQRGDVIVFDSLIHASARDGVQTSNAKHIRADHNDPESFEAALRKARAQARGRVWVAVESVYSMDGDAASLADLYTLCVQYDAYLIVDEAHGVGVCGARGKGVSEALVREKGYERIVIMHTCGKALGVAGGLVCASSEICEYLVNAARPFIYSTAPMPVQAALVQKSLELLASAEGRAQRAKLARVCALAQELLGGHGSHIVPVHIGEDARAVEVAKAIQEAGYDVRAIRPPTVPKGTARLRVSLNADLSEADLQGFADALKAVL